MAELQATQVNGYWYNMQSGGQSVHTVGGEMRSFSHLHLKVSGNTPKPVNAKVRAILPDGTCAYQGDFVLHTEDDTLGYEVKQSDDGSLHLRTEVPTLPEQPATLQVELSTDKEHMHYEIPCRYHRLHGQVTDFQGNPFRAFVRVCDESFGEGIGAWTDDQGYYSLLLPERTYNAIWVDDETYAIKTLEAWAWHIIMDEDQELNFLVGTGEVYGLTAWPSNGGLPVYFIHFRPMALSMLRPTGSEGDAPAPAQSVCQLNGREFSVTELAPDLQPEDMSVTVNSVKAEVVSVQEVLETGPDGQAMRSYLVQISRKGLPKAGKQTLCLQYRKQIERDGQLYWAESMGYCQFRLNSKGLPE